MIFQPHRYSRTKATWKSLTLVLKEVNNLMLLPTYSAGEKKTSFDSQFLFKKLKNKKKVLLKSLNYILKKVSKEVNSDTIILLQGAGDIKNIISMLKIK